MLRTVAGVALGIAVVLSPIIGLLSIVILSSEIRPDAPRSFRQNFWVRSDELTLWGRRAQLAFRFYWLALGMGLAVALVMTAIP